MRLNYDVPDWMDEANCIDASDVNDVEEMGPLCRECPVRVQCREYAVDREVTSLVWGGQNFENGEEV